MAKYGLDLYGSALYGDPDPLIYSATPFVADVINFGAINLSWRKPGGTWTGLRLVRNYFGHPVESSDGDLLLDGDGSSLSYFQDNTVHEGQWVYYSLFVYIPADLNWYRVGHLTVFSPISYDGGTNLYGRTPRIYKGTFSATSGGADDNPALAAFLALIGFQYDVLRNLTNALLDLDDAYLIDYDLVSARLAEFNIPAETSLAPLQYRQFLASAIWLYKTKGTVPCIQALCSIIMGCNSTVAVGSNLLWTGDLSDFIGGIGEWYTASAATLSWKKGQHDDFGAATQNALSIVSTATTAIVVGFVHTSDPGAMGIPVTVGIPVTAQATVTGTTASADQCRLYFSFYDASGASLGNSLGGLVSVRNGLGVIMGVTASPPAGAVYAGLWIQVTPAASGTEYRVTTIQMNYGGAVLPHQYGRDLQILLEDTALTATEIALREARLRDILPRYLPLGATFTLVHNSPPPPPATFTDDVILYGT